MVTLLARVLLDTVVGGQALALAGHTLGPVRTVVAGGGRGRVRDALAILVESARAHRRRGTGAAAISCAGRACGRASIGRTCSRGNQVTGAKASVGVENAPLVLARGLDSIGTGAVAILVESLEVGRTRPGTGAKASILVESAFACARHSVRRATDAGAILVETAILEVARRLGSSGTGALASSVVERAQIGSSARTFLRRDAIFVTAPSFAAATAF